jgi:predicted  nucleic acid-binding Zn-ribbon protein
MDLPDITTGGPATWGGTAAAVIVSLLTIRRWLSRDKVDRSLDSATVQLIQSLQLERDAANKRAADAETRSDAAMEAASKLQGEVALLRYQVQQLQQQISELRSPANSGSVQ